MSARTKNKKEVIEITKQVKKLAIKAKRKARQVKKLADKAKKQADKIAKKI